MHIINICILGSSVEHGDHINNMSKFVNIFSPISLRVSSAKQNSIKGNVIIEFMSKFSWNILWEWKEKYVNPEAPRSLMLPVTALASAYKHGCTWSGMALEKGWKQLCVPKSQHSDYRVFVIVHNRRSPIKYRETTLLQKGHG